MQFFYSHGFHSSQNSLSYKGICAGLNLAPLELIYENGGDFRANLQACKSQLIEHKFRPPFGFIGNSLGAFYLWQLILHAPKLNIALPEVFILFNPVFEPLSQLKKYINIPQSNSTTGAGFSLSRKNWQSYAHALRTPMPSAIRTLVFLSVDDERIDGSISEAYWGEYAQIRHIQGGHIISDFSALYADVHSFLMG